LKDRRRSLRGPRESKPVVEENSDCALGDCGKVNRERPGKGILGGSGDIVFQGAKKASLGKT